MMAQTIGIEAPHRAGTAPGPDAQPPAPQVQALAAAGLPLATVAKLVRHEVHRPCLTGAARFDPLTTLNNHLAPPGKLRAQLQLRFAVQAIGLTSTDLPAPALEQHMHPPMPVADSRIRVFAISRIRCRRSFHRIVHGGIRD